METEEDEYITTKIILSSVNKSALLKQNTDIKKILELCNSLVLLRGFSDECLTWQMWSDENQTILFSYCYDKSNKDEDKMQMCGIIKIFQLLTLESNNQNIFLKFMQTSCKNRDKSF